MSPPRILTIMGSGETAPTMAKVHRSLIERVGGVGGGLAVLLDTPYGFQENASDISARAQEYFATSVGTPIAVASFRARDVDDIAAATAIARIRDASYVFAGPGSPTYALTHWATTPIPALMADKLRHGGAVTFASAAALTVGLATVPVYEIYKAGQPAQWIDGLNLLEAATGLRAAVIPHFDNAEGGHHDTRFCYLGERRLSLMERELPADAFVLGVDEHTAAVFDLEAATITVVGLGVVTVRRRGTSRILASGSTHAVASLGDDHAGDGSAGGTFATATAIAAATPVAVVERSPLLAEAARLDDAFTAALTNREVSAALAALLELERVIVEWSHDTLQSDEPDRARAVLHSMIVRVGELAAIGARDPRSVIGPLVEVIVREREAARQTQDFAASDRLRDALASAGVELRDTPNGPQWHQAT